MQPDPRGADDPQRARQRRRLEAGHLAGQCRAAQAGARRGGPRRAAPGTAARGEPAQRRPQPGQRGERRRDTPGRGVGDLRRPAQGDRRGRDRAGRGDPGFARGYPDLRHHGVPRGREEGIGLRDGEPGVDRRGLAAQVVVEPAEGRSPQPVGLGDPAVVPARVPDHLHRGSGSGDAARVGVSLRQREERIGLALDEQRRGVDPAEHPGRAGGPEQVEDAGGRPPGGGRLLVGRAQVGGEPPAPRGGGDDLARPRRARPGRPRTARTGGTRPRGAEELPRPHPLEHPGGVDGGQRSGRGRRPRPHGELREQGLPQVVPGDLRHHRVDPRVGACEQQRQSAAVRSTDNADPGVVRPVLHHLGAPAQQVDQQPGVGDLVVGGVEVDQSAAGPEAAGGEREHDEPLPGQVEGVRGQVGLRAAEPVGHQHRRLGPPGRGQEQRRVQGDGAGTGFWCPGHPEHLLAHRRRPGGPGRHRRPSEHEHSGAHATDDCPTPTHTPPASVLPGGNRHGPLVPGDGLRRRPRTDNVARTTSQPAARTPPSPRRGQRRASSSLRSSPQAASVTQPSTSVTTAQLPTTAR